MKRKEKQALLEFYRKKFYEVYGNPEDSDGGRVFHLVFGVPPEDPSPDTYYFRTVEEYQEFLKLPDKMRQLQMELYMTGREKNCAAAVGCEWEDECRDVLDWADSHPSYDMIDRIIKLYHESRGEAADGGDLQDHLERTDYIMTQLLSSTDSE